MGLRRAERGSNSSYTVCSHLDLFSGIGGFALAARWLGIETQAFCEIDPWARRVLEKNFPGVPIHEDVKKLDGKQYEGIDLITGGYPCQPFSHAGQRRGQNDDRHLWPEMFRIIKDSRASWVLCENVVGHISMGIDDVIDDLEGIGYEVAEPLVIPACAVGTYHRRDRVWILANAVRGNETVGWNGSGSWRITEQAEENKVCQMEVESLWCRTLHGIPCAVDRLRGLGNAIVPQVAFEIMRAILISENKEISELTE